MTAGDGDLYRAFCEFLTEHIRKIRGAGHTLITCRVKRARLCGLYFRLTSEMRDKRPQIVARIDGHSVDNARLGGIAIGHKYAVQSRIACGNDPRQHPADRADLTAERQLSEKKAVLQHRRVRNNAAGTEQRDTERQVVARALLFLVGGGHVDDYLAVRELVPALPQRAAYAILGFLHRCVRQSDDIENGHSLHSRALDGDYHPVYTAQPRSVYP